MAASVVIAPGQDPFPRLREAPVFAKLPDPAVKELAQVVDFSVITPGERIQRPQEHQLRALRLHPRGPAGDRHRTRRGPRHP
jgi:hypothetical protein